ncbi:hypothetical protein HNR68_003308 [Saccharopolyspora hordei]|uniref:Uncharacterized protein n=1 Tax=Saccharopolyspora hordei TaxID=1838 RepID=A0A853AKW3_9PSEU|nr:hypothetical protein [Saccharopolyspora hordei]
MASLVRWLGEMAREMQRARTVMRHPQSSVHQRNVRV